jgi:hypothetical protein
MDTKQIFARASEIVDAALEIKRSSDQTHITYEMRTTLELIVSNGLKLERLCIDAQNQELTALIAAGEAVSQLSDEAHANFDHILGDA